MAGLAQLQQPNRRNLQQGSLLSLQLYAQKRDDDRFTGRGLAI